ncbi:Ig-like domain-containing protein [Mycobacterium sp. NPDC003323]
MNAQPEQRPPTGRHRRARGAGVVQATFPTFQLQATPALTPGLSMPIGRVGALAVALGVGFAVSTAHGAGSARADEASTKSASAESSSVDSETQSTSSDDAQSASEPTSGPQTDPDVPDDEAEVDEPRTDDTDTEAPELEEPAPSDDPDNGTEDTEDAGNLDDTAPAEPARPTDPRDTNTLAEPERASSGPRHAAQSASAPALSVRPLVTATTAETTTPEVTPPTLRVASGAPDAAPMTATCGCSVAPVNLDLPTPIELLVGVPVAAVYSVLGIAQNLLSAFLNPPGGTAQPGLLWVALAWARREIEHTFFNRSPRVDDQEITLTLDPGQSSTPIDLGATDREGDRLTYRVPTTGSRAPEHGTVTVDQSTGTLVYTPTDQDFTGMDIFTVSVSDKMRGFHLHGPLGWMFKKWHGHTDTAVITIHVNPDSTEPPTGTITPVVRNDALTTAEDADGTGNVLANDGIRTGDGAQPGGDGSLIASLAAGPTHGRVVLHDDGTYTYTPDADYHGTDSFTYTATTIGAGGGVSATATVTVIVTPVNDAPFGLAGQSGFGTEDTTFGGQLLADDIDSAATSLGYAVADQARHGSVTVSPTGTWSYTPDPDYTGIDSFTFTVSDGQGASTPVTVSVEVTAVDDPPVALPGQAGTGAEDTTFGGQLLATDIDGSAGAPRYALDTQATHGRVTVNADGSWTYTPDADFHGTDSFTFTVSDAAGTSTPAQVTLTVTPVYDPPAGNPAAASGDEDRDISGQLTAAGGEADDMTFTLDSSPAHGSVTIDPSGTWTYTPDPDFHGADSFTYTVDDGRAISDPVTVTVTINPVNDAPTAQAGTDTATEDGAPITGSFEFSDIDLGDGGDQVTVSVTQPAGGTVTVTADGAGYIYTPSADFSGVDTFTYTVTDAAGAQSSATITVTVTAVNDRPIATSGLHGTVVEDAVNGVGGTLAGTDADADSLKYNLGVQAANGFVTIDESTGAWTYTPNADFHGTDTFSFTVNDGTLISTPVQVTVHVTGVNDVPVAVDDVSLGTDEDAALTISRTSLTANDTDADKDELTITAVGQPDHGTVTVAADGSFVYTPDADYHGVDGFTYTVSDGLGASSTARVTVAVASVPDAPVANPDTVTTDGATVMIEADQLLANDTDGDGDGLTAIIVDHPLNGDLIDNGDGTFTYIPDADHSGSDSFTYIASDGGQVSPTTVVTITVAAAL